MMPDDNDYSNMIIIIIRHHHEPCQLPHKAFLPSLRHFLLCVFDFCVCGLLLSPLNTHILMSLTSLSLIGPPPYKPP